MFVLGITGSDDDVGAVLVDHVAADFRGPGVQTRLLQLPTEDLVPLTLRGVARLKFGEIQAIGSWFKAILFRTE